MASRDMWSFQDRFYCRLSSGARGRGWGEGEREREREQEGQGQGEGMGRESGSGRGRGRGSGSGSRKGRGRGRGRGGGGPDQDADDDMLDLRPVFGRRLLRADRPVARIVVSSRHHLYADLTHCGTQRRLKCGRGGGGSRGGGGGAGAGGAEPGTRYSIMLSRFLTINPLILIRVTISVVVVLPLILN